MADDETRVQPSSAILLSFWSNVSVTLSRRVLYSTEAGWRVAAAPTENIRIAPNVVPRNKLLVSILVFILSLSPQFDAPPGFGLSWFCKVSFFPKRIIICTNQQIAARIIATSLRRR